MKKTKLYEKPQVKKTKLRLERETLHALEDGKLGDVPGGVLAGRAYSYWCSVGQFVGGCR